MGYSLQISPVDRPRSEPSLARDSSMSAHDPRSDLSARRVSGKAVDVGISESDKQTNTTPMGMYC